MKLDKVSCYTLIPCSGFEASFRTDKLDANMSSVLLVG
jgi:hypothetical protein